MFAISQIRTHLQEGFGDVITNADRESFAAAFRERDVLISDVGPGKAYS